MSADFINADPGSTELAIRNLFRQAQLLVEQDSKSLYLLFIYILHRFIDNYFDIFIAVCVVTFEKAESLLNGKSANARRVCAQLQDCLISVRKFSRLLIIATTSMPHLIDASFKQGSRFSYEVIYLFTY